MPLFLFLFFMSHPIYTLYLLKKMIHPKTNYSLKSRNTFGIDAKCQLFFESDSIDELKEAVTRFRHIPLLILGGGSNILFTKNFEGLVVSPSLKTIEILHEDDLWVTICVAAGVEWDELVNMAVGKGWGGLENLSLIPGNVGASPIQNIGAYGVEAKDSIEEVKGFYIDSLQDFTLSNTQCHFGYRDSIFKRDLKGKVLITHVVFKLSKVHKLITNYGSIAEELEKFGQQSISAVRQAVISIREAKLPNPKEIGNAGSFFKNPVVSSEIFNEIKNRFPQVPSYPADNTTVKLPAGWLIETCGWKGKRIGNVGVHAKQALVLVNFGGSKGSEIVELAQKIQQSVKTEFGIELEMEVNLV